MKKILIVEDHADIRRLIRMTLDFADVECEIHEAADGRARAGTWPASCSPTWCCST
jgi:CheY-like chemotaxis protein